MVIDVLIATFIRLVPAGWIKVCLLCLSPMLTFSAPVVAANHEPGAGVTHAMIQPVIPSIPLIRDDGVSVDFPRELDVEGPVVLSFLFTSCRATCPMSIGLFKDLEARAHLAGVSLHLYSVSIDPDTDTPALLGKFRHDKGAGPNWHFYTGNHDDVIALQRVFKTYRGDKMNHLNVVLVRKDRTSDWEWITGSYIPASEIADALALPARKQSQSSK